MCGIAGIAGARSDSLPPRMLQAALDLLQHRGPDGSDTEVLVLVPPA
jgi:asparagine synthetase B (glutamine-hydrolysing)